MLWPFSRKRDEAAKTDVALSLNLTSARPISARVCAWGKTSETRGAAHITPTRNADQRFSCARTSILVWPIMAWLAQFRSSSARSEGIVSTHASISASQSPRMVAVLNADLRWAQMAGPTSCGAKELVVAFLHQRTPSVSAERFF